MRTFVGRMGREEEGRKTHKEWVEKLPDSDEGAAGMLHNIAKPLLWKEAQVAEDVFEDAQPLKRLDEERPVASKYGRTVWRKQAAEE